MRADGGSRNGKIDKARLVGVGMMLAGIVSITFAVAGVSGAGTSGAALPAHHQCESGWDYSSTTGQLAGAINKGCNQTTTTWNEQCGCNTTSTTEPVTTTSHEHCGCTTTTTEAPTSTSVAASTTLFTTTTATSTTTATTMPASTTTASSMPTSTSGSTTTTVAGLVATTAGKLSVQGVTSSLPGSITVEGTSATLPFTGGSPWPLAGLGVVLLATGAGLSRRKRNLA
jgi:hypothetical protein